MGPLDPKSASPDWHWRWGPVYLGTPVVTSGDSPHYLILVNSLIEDWDLDLTNNHEQANRGDWDGGARVRAGGIGGHSEIDHKGRKLSFHAFYRPLALAFLVFPAQGTEWVEPLTIWVTMLGTLLALLALGRAGALPPRWIVLLAVATPLWAYSRDLWNEAWMAGAWIFLLVSPGLPALALAAAAGTLFKMSFAVVPWSMAAVAFLQGKRRRAVVLLAAPALALLAAFLATQWVYQDSDHFSLFHLGHRHFPGGAPFQFPGWNVLRGGVGLLFDPRSGLLPFSPFLAWGLLTAGRDLGEMIRRRRSLWAQRPSEVLGKEGPRLLERAYWTLPACVFFLSTPAMPDGTAERATLPVSWSPCFRCLFTGPGEESPVGASLD